MWFSSNKHLFMHADINPDYESECCVCVCVWVFYLHNTVAGSSCSSLFVFGLRSRGPAGAVTDVRAALTPLGLWEIYGSPLGLVPVNSSCVSWAAPPINSSTPYEPFLPSVPEPRTGPSACLRRASSSAAVADGCTICMCYINCRLHSTLWWRDSFTKTRLLVFRASCKCTMIPDTREEEQQPKKKRNNVSQYVQTSVASRHKCFTAS